MSHTASPVAPTILTAAALVGVEALGLAAFAVVDLVSADGSRVGSAVGTALFFVVCAGGLGLAARGLSRRERWARGPVVLSQLIVLGLAWGLRASSASIAAVLTVVAVAVLGCVLAPATTRQLFATEDDEAT